MMGAAMKLTITPQVSASASGEVRANLIVERSGDRWTLERLTLAEVEILRDAMDDLADRFGVASATVGLPAPMPAFERGLRTLLHKNAAKVAGLERKLRAANDMIAVLEADLALARRGVPERWRDRLVAWARGARARLSFTVTKARP